MQHIISMYLNILIIIILSIHLQIFLRCVATPYIAWFTIMDTLELLLHRIVRSFTKDFDITFSVGANNFTEFLLLDYVEIISWDLSRGNDSEIAVLRENSSNSIYLTIFSPFSNSGTKSNRIISHLS